jgi:hypothetical protein
VDVPDGGKPKWSSAKQSWIGIPRDGPVEVDLGSPRWAENLDLPSATVEYPVEPDGTVSVPMSFVFETVRAAAFKDHSQVDPGRYITDVDFLVELPDEGAVGAPNFILKIHLGFLESQRKVICVGMDLRSFTDVDDRPVGLPLEHLTAAKLRALKLGSYVEAAIDRCKLWLSEIAEEQAFVGEDKAEIEALLENRAKPRGRKPALSDSQLIELVVQPYMVGGRQKTERVRQALQKSGVLPPLQRGGEVDIQQARKQIDRARARGLLPRRRTKDSG